MRGVEDLGGGLSASFWLESFLAMDTGAVNPPGFGRRSTVSLADRSWGELRLGRDYTPTHSNWSRFDPFGYVGIGSNQLLILSATGSTPVRAAFGADPNTVQRVSNGVQYLLPRNRFGLDGGVVYAFREGGTTAQDDHHAVGGRLGFTTGKFYVSAASLHTRNTTTNDTFKDTALGASYDAGVVKVSAAIRRFDFQASRQNTSIVGAVVPLGVHELKASWVRASWDGRIGGTSIEANRADQYALGYVYNFSKTTRVYATWATLRNKGGSRFVIPGAPAATGNGQSSRGFEMGINKDF
jgi:predicted porin